MVMIAESVRINRVEKGSPYQHEEGVELCKTSQRKERYDVTPNVRPYMNSVDYPRHLVYHTLSTRVSRIQECGTCLTRPIIAVIQRYTDFLTFFNTFNILTPKLCVQRITKTKNVKKTTEICLIFLSLRRKNFLKHASRWKKK